MSTYPFAAIIQIRRGSSRLPDKVFLPIGDKLLIEHVLSRLKAATSLNAIIVATSTNPLDDKVEEWCAGKNVYCFRGSENNVMDRFIQAAKQYDVENTVRVCGDNPFLDVDLINLLVSKHAGGEFDLTVARDNLVLGAGVEIINAKTLEGIYQRANKGAYREHVTPYFHDHPEEFRLNFVKAPLYLSAHPYRITVDAQEDIELCRNVYNSLFQTALDSASGIVSTRQVVDFLQNNPEIAAMNQDVQQKNWKVELETEA